MSDEVDPWARSGLLAITIGFPLTGTAFGQLLYYFRSFPYDKLSQKLFISFLFILDVLHTYAIAYQQWRRVVHCHRQPQSTSCSVTCTTTWQYKMILGISILVQPMVQCFYSYRIWTISGRNKVLTGTVGLMAVSAFVIALVGTIFSEVAAITAPSVDTTIPAGVLAAVCDIMIASAICWYLRPGHSGARRTEPRIASITQASVQAGIITSILACLLAIFSAFPSISPYSTVVSTAVTKSYINSTIAVLNARKPAGYDLSQHSSIALSDVPSLTFSRL